MVRAVLSSVKPAPELDLLESELILRIGAKFCCEFGLTGEGEPAREAESREVVSGCPAKVDSLSLEWLDAISLLVCCYDVHGFKPVIMVLWQLLTHVLEADW
jgi:hypothetical protein